MRIPHGVTAFGVGAATTSYILQQQKAEAQKKENDKLRNELSEIKEDLDKIQSSQDEIKKGQEMLIRKVENIETNTKKLINNFNISSIRDLFNKILDFFSELDFFSTSLIYNIICSSFLLSLLFSFLIGKYGNYLIARFNLEVKYPKLVRIFKFRLQLQKYYFTYLTILAILTLLSNIILNINALIIILS